MSAMLNSGNHSPEHQHSTTPDHLATGDLLSDNELHQHHLSRVPPSVHDHVSCNQKGHVDQHADHQPVQPNSEV